MFKPFKEALIGIFLFVLCCPIYLSAQSSQGKELAEIWVVDIPFQQAAEFKTVLKDYIDERAAAGDVNSWQIFRAQASSHLDSYLIRHCCFQKSQRAHFEDWMSANELNKDWTLAEGLQVHDSEHFFSQVKDSERVDIDASDKIPKVAVSQFTLDVGVLVDGSTSRLKQSAKEMRWGDNWAWTFEDHSKGLLNLDFSIKDVVENDTEFSAFDFEQQVNNLQFHPNANVSQSRYLVYEYLKDF